MFFSSISLRSNRIFQDDEAPPPEFFRTMTAEEARSLSPCSEEVADIMARALSRCSEEAAGILSNNDRTPPRAACPTA